MSIDRLSQIIDAADPVALLPSARRSELRAIAQSPAHLRRLAFEALPESVRLRLIRSAGAVPPVCGPDIPTAPARGAVQAIDYLRAYPKGDDQSELKPAGHAGRKTMMRLDVFGLIAAQSQRRGGDPILTESQIGMGRSYRTLSEDIMAGAVRCSSMEAMRGGGGSPEGFTDHRLDMSRRLDLLQRRIGSGCSMSIRRIRPSKRGGVARRNIPDRVLVDSVCLHDLDPSTVLRGYGWCIKGDTVRAVTLALAEALERMIGPQPRVKIDGIVYGDQAQWSVPN